MTSFAAKLYTSLVAVYGITTALEAGPHAQQQYLGECMLSSVQATAIKATVAPWRNSSCVYNMTVESLLGPT